MPRGVVSCVQARGGVLVCAHRLPNLARRFKRFKTKRKRGAFKTKKSIFDLYNEQNPPKETSTDNKTVARVEDETKTVKKEETKTEETKTEETKTEETKTEETKTEETKTEEKGGEE